MKILKIECTAEEDGFVSVLITGENGDFITATVPTEKFVQGVVDLAEDAEVTRMPAICLQ